MSKIDINGDGKADFSVSPMQIISFLAMFASIVGSYYTLSAKIESNDTAIKKLKENEQKYTWPAQRKLESDFQEIKLEMRDFMKDLEWIQRENDNKKRK
jgi:hypothetical protein